MVATHLAATGLVNGEAQTSISAGVNLMLVPDTPIHLAALGALSANGRCATQRLSCPPPHVHPSQVDWLPLKQCERPLLSYVHITHHTRIQGIGHRHHIWH